jgi:hypothetical protein
MITPEFTAEEQGLLLRGEKFKALRLYRARTGASLRECKDAADRFLQDPSAPSVACPNCGGTGRVMASAGPGGMTRLEMQSWVLRSCKFAQKHKCRHCGEEFEPAYCDECDKSLTSQCMECHDEVAHDVVEASSGRNQKKHPAQ